MSFLLFAYKFGIFWILYSNWVRLNSFILCFIIVCLHEKVIVIIASQMIFVAFAINIHNEVPFKKECFTNFFPFSSIPFTISGAQFKEAGYSKYITFNSGNYLIMSVTFDVSHVTG